MTPIINSNILYGVDDPDDDGVYTEEWASLGEMVLSNLTNGDKRDLFVSTTKCN